MECVMRPALAVESPHSPMAPFGAVLWRQMQPPPGPLRTDTRELEMKELTLRPKSHRDCPVPLAAPAGALVAHLESLAQRLSLVVESNLHRSIAL